jgi:hypothetical protein
MQGQFGGRICCWIGGQICGRIEAGRGRNGDRYVVAHVVICVAPCVAARVSWVVSWVASGGASRRAFRRLSCGVGR